MIIAQKSKHISQIKAKLIAVFFIENIRPINIYLELKILYN